MMTGKEDAILHSWRTITRVLEQGLAPLIDFAARLLLFKVFFSAGWDQLNQWEQTLTRFREVYQVPFLSPAVAATLTVGSELVGSVMVLLGVGARLGAVALLEVTIVIQFWLALINPAYNRPEHWFWLVLLLLMVARGPGRLSLDHLLRRLLER